VLACLEVLPPGFGRGAIPGIGECGLQSASDEYVRGRVSMTSTHSVVKSTEAILIGTGAVIVFNKALTSAAVPQVSGFR
jgi:hypothetical protein